MQFIVLTGPKHSGKTSAAKALASLIFCGFADLDDCITQRSGTPPRSLYIEGPEIFRKAETEALAALFQQGTEGSVLVIAPGGGLADNPEALALLARNTEALTVFLEVSAHTAWVRISREELPPFLKTENPQETHRLLHERRAAAYRQIASLTINADGKSPEQIAQEIKDAIK